jgi:hypothetical protein
MVPDRSPLKLLRRRTDPWGIMRSELACPVCNADVPMNGDEKLGDEVFCAYCGAPLTLKDSREDSSEMELEEDF